VPSSTARKDDGVSFQFAVLATLCNDPESCNLPFANGQIACESMLEHFYIGYSQRPNERRLNGQTGRIALSMENTRARVGSF
jgi:hypothetical protein